MEGNTSSIWLKDTKHCERQRNLYALTICQIILVAMWVSRNQQLQRATSIEEVLSSVPIPKEENVHPHYVGDCIQEFLNCFKCSISSRLKMQVMNCIFKLIIVDLGGMDYLNYVTPDFPKICFSAMKTLHKEKKHLILELCKCFEQTDITSQSRMPLDRMPFGLIDYNSR